ncbi:MAG TPA: LssY C-terminal domain-containing protein [Candidatus Acidoferrales bacterium]|nr:LssY C-terminal domain-containing protein [Candidatus Acidoferrales bacterium]
MASRSSFWSVSGSLLSAGALSLCLCLCLGAAGLQAPAGTEMQIRLKTKISTQTSKPKDPVEAVVIAPVMVGDQFAIPAGAVVHGDVEKAAQSSKGDERSVLVLNFTEMEINGAKLKLAAQLTDVENGREKVDAQGQISGILASETISGRLDAELNKLAEKSASFADILNTVKKTVLKAPESDIVYDAGVEMDLKLTAPLELTGPSGPGPAAKVKPIANEKALLDLLAAEPFQTMAQKPAKASDITNIMLAGTEEQVRKAFAEAGWSSAAALSTEAKLETFRAIAEQRGYKEAPVSVLLLDGKPPGLVFEKLNNTFARRHHLRVWRRPASFQGQPVWMIAATHDNGIDFSEENRTFIHKIDSQIDRERAKVVNDLLFTGHVQALALVDRPNVPLKGQNATGDSVETDAKIAVLVLR